MIEEQPQTVSSDSFASFSEYLAPGEGVVVYSDALVRESGIVFDKCKVVLTRQRLIIIKHGWPWGYKVDRTLPRDDCRVLKQKVRFDGSELMIVEHPAGVLCLFFHRGARDEAAAIRGELGVAPSPADGPGSAAGPV